MAPGLRLIYWYSDANRLYPDLASCAIGGHGRVHGGERLLERFEGQQSAGQAGALACGRAIECRPGAGRAGRGHA